jgi:protein-disulfide isomerase
LAALAVASFAAAPPVAAPARAGSFSAGQKAEIEAIIKDYLLQKPEILRDAANVLEAREKEALGKEREKITSDPSGALFNPANQAVIGNPIGRVTLVEFFDYNCGYCKRALGDVARLISENPDLRVVLRDFPILSPGSVEAAQVADAFLRQFQGDKFWEFHRRLLGSHGHIGKEEALAIAKDLGADMDKLSKDANDPAIAAGLAESENFAKSLQTTGTPTFVVGNEVLIGAVGFDELQAKIANVKKCGKAVCS